MGREFHSRNKTQDFNKTSQGFKILNEINTRIQDEKLPFFQNEGLKSATHYNNLKQDTIRKQSVQEVPNYVICEDEPPMEIYRSPTKFN